MPDVDLAATEHVDPSDGEGGTDDCERAGEGSDTGRPPACADQQVGPSCGNRPDQDRERYHEIHGGPSRAKDEPGRTREGLRATGIRPKFMEKLAVIGVHVDPAVFATEGPRR